MTIHKCIHCDKSFAKKFNLDRHLQQDRCKIRQVDFEDTIMKLEKKLMDAENKLKCKDFELKTKDKHIKYLEKRLDSVINTIAKRPTYTTNNNNNNTYNNKTKNQILVQNLKPLTLEKINSSIPSLNLDIMLRGAEGYSEWAHEQFLKDSVRCTDYSRGILKWKNDEDTLIQDPQGIKLKKFIFDAIKTENNEIIRVELIKLSDELQQNASDLFTSENIVKRLNELYELREAILKCASGESCRFSDKFIKSVCSKVKENETIVNNEIVINNEIVEL